MLDVKGVYKKYKDKQVLKGVNLKVEKGQIKGLVGVNGAGKTTLIELICRVKQADKGEILVDGIKLNNAKKIKRIVGYMPQSFSLFLDLTVRENLDYLCAVYGLDEKVIDKILVNCNLVEMKNKLAKNLSGGYKQLLSLAGAIVHSPKLLILDEPTSAMDPIFRKEFWKIINNCKSQGTTVLIITHYMEELLNCDSFACLSNGVIVFDGKVSDYSQNGLIDFEKLIKGEKSEKN